jgi:hypothetical protein
VSGPTTFRVVVVDDDAHLLRASRGLRTELLRHGLEVEHAVEDDPEEGAKSGALVAIGTIIATAATPELVTLGIDTVLGWMGRQAPSVEVELNGNRFKGPVTMEQRDALVAAILDNAGKPES